MYDTTFAFLAEVPLSIRLSSNSGDLRLYENFIKTHIEGFYSRFPLLKFLSFSVFEDLWNSSNTQREQANPAKWGWNAWMC